MLKARLNPLDLVRKVPLPDKEQLHSQLHQLQSSALFQHLLVRLQERVLELQRDQSNSSTPSQSFYRQGMVVGASAMLERIDLVLSELSRGASTRLQDSSDPQIGEEQ